MINKSSFESESKAGEAPVKMDPEASVLLHCPQGLQEHQVRVEISTRFNRINIHEVEKHIDAVWNSRVTKDSWLFNGAKFRLQSAHFSMTHPSANCYHMTGDTVTGTSDAENDKSLRNPHAHKTVPAHLEAQDKLTDDEVPSETLRVKKSSCCQEITDVFLKNASAASVSLRKASEQKQGILCLKLGLTCYKDFLGTNWSHKAVSLQQRGKLEFGDSQALLAQPLGVGAVLLTSDEQVVMLRRSQRVAEAAGLLDIPGGHPEPKAVCQGVSEEAISVKHMHGCESSIVSEIFSSVCAEIRDEVNVPLSVLNAPLLMGIALNHTSAGRPSAEFFIRCSLTMKEIKDLYWQGGPEAHESTDIVFLSRTEMLHLDAKSSLWSKLCPSAKGAVLLYQLVQPH